MRNVECVFNSEVVRNPVFKLFSYAYHIYLYFKIISRNIYTNDRVSEINYGTIMFVLNMYILIVIMVIKM